MYDQKNDNLISRSDAQALILSHDGDCALLHLWMALTGSKDLEPGKFYSVNMVSLYHPNVDYDEQTYDLDWIPWGIEPETESDEPMTPVKCLTGTDFVLESDVKGCVFDMELAYIKALGFEYVIAYKYVSDNLDLQEYREKFYEE